MESPVILKNAPLFGKHIGNGCDGRVGPGSGGITMVDGAVGVQHAPVLQTSPLLFGPAFQRFTKPLSAGESCRPRGRILRSGERRRSQGRKRQKKAARTRRARTGGPHRGSDSALHKRPNRPRSSGLLPKRAGTVRHSAEDTLDYRCAATTRGDAHYAEQWSEPG